MVLVEKVGMFGIFKRKKSYIIASLMLHWETNARKHLRKDTITTKHKSPNTTIKATRKFDVL